MDTLPLMTMKNRSIGQIMGERENYLLLSAKHNNPDPNSL